MKRLKAILVLIAMSLTSFSAMASDTAVDGIYYDFDSENKTAIVTYSADYTGDVVIPATVTYNGVEYTVTEIGDRAFERCSGLTSITISEGVTAIGDYAFSGCYGLTSITIPEGVTAIGDYAFEYCSGLTSITIPEGVKAIGMWAFSYCSCLTSITIPEGVTAIRYYSFYKCSGLTSITIPEGVTAIANSAFEDCSGLTSITIPESVTAIGWCALDGCSGLTSIISLNTTPPSCDGSYVFDNVDKSIPLYVPKESVDSYKSAKCWSEFTNIVGNMLRLTINDAVNGMVTGAGVYPVDSTATVTVTSNAGYAFVKWSDGNTDNPRKIVMTEDVTLEAIFEADSSPISNVTAEEITVRVVNGTLVVTGASDYLVYDLAGKCKGKPERLERGIYIVVADGNSYKMIVK